MNIKEITLELMVKDVDETIHFYKEVLGFELLASEQDGGKSYWAKMSNHGFGLSFKEEQRLKREEEYYKDQGVGGSLAICFDVEDLEGYHGQVEQKCDLLNHPHLTPCGATQFSMRDNNGYLLTFERF